MEPVEVSDIIKINLDTFNNFRRKHVKKAQIHPDCWQTLQNYCHMINQEGSISTLENIYEE